MAITTRALMVEVVVMGFGWVGEWVFLRVLGSGVCEHCLDVGDGR